LRYNQFLVIWGGAPPYPAAGRFPGWKLNACRRLPGSKPSDRCKCTLAAGSLITVTRSCGICTRFPFTLSHAPNGGIKRHLLSYSVLRC